MQKLPEQHSDEVKGIVFDIQGFTVHDGPGCRTLIFLKGCTMNCLWCSNPEGISPFSEPMFRSGKCISDNNCIVSCPFNAATQTSDGIIFNKSVCSSCRTYNCKSSCLTGAVDIAGYSTSVTELLRIIQRDRQFWGNNGGITITGGEPFSQPGFSMQILRECYNRFIHTAAETCGNVPWNNISCSLPFLDWIFFDIKHMSSDVHKKMTGIDNSLIIHNARRLCSEFEGRLIFRLPVISGYNDSEDNIRNTARFLLDNGKNEINILPLHHLGKEKYQLLQMEYTAGKVPVPSTDDLIRIRDLFLSYNINCYIGSSTPF